MSVPYNYVAENFWSIPIKPKKTPMLSLEYPPDYYYFYVEFVDGIYLEVIYTPFDKDVKTFKHKEEIKDTYGIGIDNMQKLSKDDGEIYSQICEWIYNLNQNPTQIKEIYYGIL